MKWLLAAMLLAGCTPIPMKPACDPTAEVCDDAIDNDCDGAIDCDDVQCLGQACAAEFNDCERARNRPATCNRVGQCEKPLVFEDCTDGLDNDCNGQVDCEDTQCSGVRCAPRGLHPACVPDAVCSGGACAFTVAVGANCTTSSCREGERCDASGVCTGGFSAPDGVFCAASGTTCSRGSCALGICHETGCSQECSVGLCVPHHFGSFCQVTPLADGMGCSRGECFGGMCLTHARQTAQTTMTIGTTASFTLPSDGYRSMATIVDGGVITFKLRGLDAEWTLWLPSTTSPGTHAVSSSSGNGPFLTMTMREIGAVAGDYESYGGVVTLDQVDIQYGGGRVEGAVNAMLSKGFVDAGLSATFSAEFR